MNGLGRYVYANAPVRRSVLTEMAEVWSRRNQRVRLVAASRALLERAPDAEGADMLHGIRIARLASDREHLASLRRVLAALREV